MVTIFLRKKITLTGALFTEASRGVQNNWGIFPVSVLIFLVLAGFLAFWVSSFVYLYSIPASNVKIPKSPADYDVKIRNLMYYQVFAFFWITATISGVFKVTVAGSISTWYFSRGTRGIIPTVNAFVRSATLSFGSIAFGALILAVAQTINFFLAVTKRTNFKNRPMVCLISVLQCFLGIIIRFIKFINRYTYISIAMHGESFCTSARRATELVSSNLFSATVVHFLGDFVLFVGKLMGTTLTALFVVGLTHSLNREVGIVTIVIAVVCAYIVFSFFANIISVSVDTVFVCYCEDLENSKKGDNLHIDINLHEMIQNSNNAKGINGEEDWK